ncbi:uncharacterized protein ACRADG_001408 [Cochliomyia hominivorax]
MALITAEPPRYRQSKNFGNLKIKKNNKFALQENAKDVAPSPAPYPPSGVTPEISFDLPTETEAPATEHEQAYYPPETTPDDIYGPPKATPEQTYGPSDAAITDPDNTYGPPIIGDQPAIEPEDEEIPQYENQIQPRNKNLHIRSHSAPLRSNAIQTRFNTVEIIHSEPVLIYTLN